MRGEVKENNRENTKREKKEEKRIDYEKEGKNNKIRGNLNERIIKRGRKRK